jgi:hypothetical protein
MSFRLVDLKKSVRKGKEGYVVTPARLEGRSPGFRIEFLLQQFEDHLGRPRRMLDPDSLLEFVGDARLGRGLLATLAQWYRVRPRTFAELLERWYPGGGRPAGLEQHAIAGPVDFRAWLYAAVNGGGSAARGMPTGLFGYLEPEQEGLFWQARARALGLRREELPTLMRLDRPEEAILVRTGPRPSAADVMAAYNARAHTTLLRSAEEVTLTCEGPAVAIERAARAWADPLDVEWDAGGERLRLFGRADALGCWTRHGRRLERAALELLTLPELGARELDGRVQIRDKSCRFHWKRDTLALLGAGRGSPRDEDLPGRVDTLAATLRRERDRSGESAWSIRRASHLIGVENGVCLPHLELRCGDQSLFLRLDTRAPHDAAAAILTAFSGKTRVALVASSGVDADPLVLRFAGEAPVSCTTGEVLSLLEAHLEQGRDRIETPQDRPLKSAA